MFDPIPDPISGKSILPWAVPVTRALNAIGDKIGATARNERDRRGSSPLPWSFACTIEEGGEGEEETRTGGWYNCRAQIGFDIWGSPDTTVPDHIIHVPDQCDDGDYYLEVTLSNNTVGRDSDAAEIKLAADMDSTASDYIGGIIRIFIGTVADGKLVNAPHFNPVVYKYV
jgi:hypothetical protein